MATTRSGNTRRRCVMVTGAARRMGSKAASQQSKSLVAPTDAVTGPERQYCWLPEAISGGLQASKYSSGQQTGDRGVRGHAADDGFGSGEFADIDQMVPANGDRQR